MNRPAVIIWLFFSLMFTGCLGTTGADESCEDHDRQAETQFLEENKTKEGVIEIDESGLQYRIIENAEGPMPSGSDTVEIEYEGRFIDNTVFVSSKNTAEPIEAEIDGMIPGLKEGVQLMSEGATYEFYLPSNLGYGETASGAICPGTTLIFEVTLVEIL